MTKIRVNTSPADLVKQGKENGFVTQEDILVVFPKPEEKVADLDHLYDQLIRAGIDVLRPHPKI